MRLKFALCSALFLGSFVPALASNHIRRGPTAPRTAKAHSSRASYKPASASRVGATTHVTMDPARATEIQTALIKNGYLTGEPTGAWDANTQAAMAKLQSDNGWPTKIVPDSRAIIKLGLGPGTTSASPAIAGGRPEAYDSPSTSAVGQANASVQ